MIVVPLESEIVSNEGQVSAPKRKLPPLRSESIATALASEHVLAKDWENEEDERWNNV